MRDTRTSLFVKARQVVVWLFVAAAAIVMSAVTATAANVWEEVPAPAEMPAATKSGLASLNGIQMYYAVYGSGEPILLIHGGLGYGDLWSGVVADLMKDHEVIVADSRGHGRSSRTADPFDYHGMAEDYVALLDMLGIDKAAIVGWSDGGIIGIDIAANHPDKVTKLFAQAANANVAGANPKFGEAATVGPYVTMMAGIYSTVSPTPADFEKFTNDMLALWGGSFDYPDSQLSKIAVPTTIAVGEFDEAVLPEHSRHLAETIPGAKLLIVPKVSHFWLLQDPAGYAKAVRDFLAE